MRIGCLQFAPQVGDVENNLNRADAVLNRADPDDLDLLVLPELAFTGKKRVFIPSFYKTHQDLVLLGSKRIANGTAARL